MRRTENGGGGRGREVQSKGEDGRRMQGERVERIG